MCLDVISGKPKKTFGFGWKVFSKKDNKLYSHIFLTQKPRRVNVWIQASRADIPDFLGRVRYQSGFHIFVSREAAELWFADYQIDPWTEDCLVVRHVRYRKAHVEGTQRVEDQQWAVVVAEEMKILPLKKVVDKRKKSLIG